MIEFDKTWAAVTATDEDYPRLVFNTEGYTPKYGLPVILETEEGVFQEVVVDRDELLQVVKMVEEATQT